MDMFPDLESAVNLNDWRVQLVCLLILTLHTAHALMHGQSSWWFGYPYFAGMGVMLLIHILSTEFNIAPEPTGAALGVGASWSLAGLVLSVAYRYIQVTNELDAPMFDRAIIKAMEWWMVSRISLLGCMQLAIGYAFKGLEEPDVIIVKLVGIFSATGLATLLFVATFSLWLIRRREMQQGR
jgi:hypothetical protein